VIGFYQVLLLQPQTFDFQFPAEYTVILEQFSYITLDLPKYISIDCVVDNNYHSKLYGTAVFAAGMVGIIFLQILGAAAKTALAHHQDAKSEETKAVAAEAPAFLAACLIGSYLIYPSCTAIFSQTFNCREIDSVDYLTKDLSIKCDSAAQTAAESVAGLMLFVFSVGLPCLYLMMLRKHKPTKLNAQGGLDLAVRAPGDFTSVLHFFYDDYAPEYYYWECVELFRKLVLTAVTVQFPKGSMVQVILGAAVIIVHIILLAHFKPYKNLKHTLLALFTYTMMLFVFLGGLMLKVKTEVPKGSIFRKGISTQKVAVCLIFALVSVVVLALAMALDEVNKAARAPVMRHHKEHTKRRKPVVFPNYSEASRFHLFLSHVWSTGQDQVLAIKKELVLLVPSVRVFLDIENLTDIGGLEKNIEVRVHCV
jgi:hypothetical protein